MNEDKRRKVGEESARRCGRQTADDCRWSEEGIVEKITVQSVALTIRCQPPRSGRPDRLAGGLPLSVSPAGRSGMTHRDSCHPDSFAF